MDHAKCNKPAQLSNGWLEIDIDDHALMEKIERIARKYGADVFYPFICDGFRFTQ